MSAAPWGTVVGALMGGWPTEQFGRRATLFRVGFPASPRPSGGRWRPALRRKKQKVGVTTLPANREFVLSIIHGDAIEIATTIDSGKASTLEVKMLCSAIAEEVASILLPWKQRLPAQCAWSQDSLGVEIHQRDLNRQFAFVRAAGISDAFARNRALPPASQCTAGAPWVYRQNGG